MTNMTQTPEDKRLADERLRAYYIRLGIITPARSWESELEEFEAETSNTRRRFPRPAHIRLVNTERGYGRA